MLLYLSRTVNKHTIQYNTIPTWPSCQKDASHVGIGIWVIAVIPYLNTGPIVKGGEACKGLQW